MDSLAFTQSVTLLATMIKILIQEHLFFLLPVLSPGLEPSLIALRNKIALTILISTITETSLSFLILSKFGTVFFATINLFPFSGHC